MKRTLIGCAGIAVLATFANAIPAIAHPVNGNLPGGTSISVSINSPADGAVLPPGPVTVAGTASIGQSQPIPSTALIYVLDVSASTATQVASGCQGDQNGDGGFDQILDCEILAAKTLNNEALSPGTAGTIPEVGAAVFANGAVTADVKPAGGDQLITAPGADDNAAGGRDIDQVLNSAFKNTGGQAGVHLFTEKDILCCATNFAAGITAATSVAGAASANLRKLVVFLSDGMSTGENINPALALVPPDVDFFTFAVGTDSHCANPSNSLQQIADATGGTCTEVPDVGALPDILPGVINSQLTSLSLRVDGGPATPISTVSPGLPRNGPASVNYTVNTGPLGAGLHELCVTALGTDGGGPGNVTDCHTIRINAPPVVNAGGPYSGQEGSAVQLAGTVTDADGPSVTQQWTVTPTGNVDAGTTCAFGNAAAVSTTITCTDDGTYTLRLTANDTVNPPVVATTTLTLTNVAPSVSISTPANGSLFVRGTPVGFTAPFTDAGRNDSHTCTVDFADGSPIANGSVTEVPGSGVGSCGITHAFTALGPHNVLVTVRDDDGGSATAVVTVVIFLPAEAWALSASGIVTIAKTPHAVCPPDANLTQVGVNVPGVLVVNALNASCTVNPTTGMTTAASSVDGASLLGGLISISNIESTCHAGADGVTGSSSRVGTINGQPIGTGSGSISIPLVATVFFNQTVTNPSGQLFQHAIRVQTLLGQEIILAGCRVG
jgi:trimeric autotransporter adhesin